MAEYMSMAVGVAGSLSAAIAILDRFQFVLGKTSTARWEFESLTEILRTQQIIIQDTFEALLHSKLQPSNTYKLLLDSTSPQWQSEDIDLALKETLGDDDFILFKNVLDQINKATQCLSSSIQMMKKDFENGESDRSAIAVRARVKWAISSVQRQREIENLKKCNQSLNLMVTTAGKQKDQGNNRGQWHALENMNRCHARIDEIRRSIARDVEPTGAMLPASTTGGDAASTYTVETEVESDGPTLSFLPLSLESATEPQRILKEDGLLDTGCTACAISIHVAWELGLKIVADDKEVLTATNQELPVEGKAEMRLRWKDHEQRKYGIKLWVYVVLGLCHPILLSHDFIANHPEAWNIAKKVSHVVGVEQLNVTWFKKLSKEQKVVEEQFRTQRREENIARNEDERKQRETEMEQRLGVAPQSQSSGASSNSMAVSLSTPSNNEPNNER